jgi:hypothetical protein
MAPLVKDYITKECSGMKDSQKGLIACFIEQVISYNGALLQCSEKTIDRVVEDTWKLKTTLWNYAAIEDYYGRWFVDYFKTWAVAVFLSEFLPSNQLNPLIEYFRHQYLS